MQTLIPLVRHPTRYLGGEVNAVRKDLSRVALTVCLAFPDVYEVGMSHLGLQILYHLLNQRPEIAAERVYAPGLDMERLMRQEGITLTSLESSLPVNKFDMVGFSLQYELSYTNVLAMLDLSRIPLYSAERSEVDPLVVGGGPCAFNPEPLADFFDAFVIGEGEEAVVEVCTCLIQAKKRKRKRVETLHLLSEIEGVYIPSFFRVSYSNQGVVEGITPLKQGYERVRRRWVMDLNSTPSVTTPIVPYMKIVHDRVNLEIARGCSRGCRFCQAGIIYRPVRERSVEELERLAEISLKSSGYEEISLCSLSAGDYSRIGELLRRLMGRCAAQKIAVSFPSLRSETLTSDLMEEVKRVRKTGFTIAPEAGTQRLRDVINKGLSEEEILKTIGNVFEAGWNAIKLYFMIGLPGEKDEDLWGIVDLVKKSLYMARRGRRKVKVTVSVSTFVPKAHTPFQWEPQITLSLMDERLGFLKENIRGSSLAFKWQDSFMSYLEGIFARGDRRLGSVLISAYQKGCRFDGWGEYLDRGLWRDALQGCMPDFYTARRRERNEQFPWDHIETGVRKDFLWEEYQRGLGGQVTADCRIQGCYRCGVCSKECPGSSTHTESTGEEHHLYEMRWRDDSKKIALPVHSVKRFRMKFSKLGMGRFLSHLELISLFCRAFRRAGIPLRFTEGFHPHPKFVFGPALPVGMESTAEYGDFEITGGMEGAELVEKINRQLPEWIKIVEINEIPLKSPSISDMITKIEYVLSLKSYTQVVNDSLEGIRCKINAFLEAEGRQVQVVKKSGTQEMDIRPWVDELRLSEDASLELVLNVEGGRSIRPYDVIRELLILEKGGERKIPVLKTRVHFGGEDS